MLALISRRSTVFHGGCRSATIFLSHRYATASATPQPPQGNIILENFLINNIGFSEEEALKASRSHPRLKPITKDFTLVVSYLRDLGFSDMQTKHLLITKADLLLGDLETLKPKIQALQDLGLCGSGLVKVLLGNKSLLGRSLDLYIKPRIDFLRNVLGSDEKVVSALKRCSFLLGHYAQQNLTRLIPAFREVGFTDADFPRLVFANARSILVLTPERALEIGDRVVNELGIPRKSKMFYYGYLVLSAAKESTIDLKKAVFRSFGWSDSEVAMLFMKFPFVMRISESRLRKSLEFYMGELGYSADFLASRHGLFVVGMETRVKPRYEVLKMLDSKKLMKIASFYSAMCLKEKQFVERFLVPFKDQIPDTYESYVKTLQKVKRTRR